MTTAISTTPIAETYQDVEHLLYHIVNKFHARFGGDVEDLESESKIAFMAAYKKFNPEKGVLFSTYLYRAVWNHLITESSKARIKTTSLDGMMDDGKFQAAAPTGSAFSVWEMAEELGEDAAMVVELVFQTPADLADVAKQKGNHPRNWRSSIRDYLRNLGWKENRIVETFQEIAAAVG